MKQLRDRVAVVTGAAGGIGRATSVLLAERGCQGVAIVDVDREGLEETAKLVSDEGARVTTHVVDVSDKERMRVLADEVVAAHEAVHVLVNNAGVSVSATFEEQSLDDMEWIVGINFWGVVYGCKFFLPYLKQQEEAHIVNLSSLFGIVGLPTQSSYNATKFAVRGLSESLYAELATTNVGVTLVHPGGVDTNIVRKSRLADESSRSEMVERFAKIGIPPEHCARRIVDAIEDGTFRLLVCRETYVVDWLKRYMPDTTHQLIAWAARTGRLEM